MQIHYTRLSMDADGVTRFEDDTLDCARVEIAPSVPPLELSAPLRSGEFQLMHAPKGWTSGFHTVAARALYFVLSGQWEIRAGSGETRRFSTGAVLLAEDTVGKGHASRVIGDTDSLVAVVRLD